jgi:flagellar hook-basal body complex protein FliE
MNISSIDKLSEFSQYAAGSVSAARDNRNVTFESLFEAAKGMINETNSYINAAEEAEIAYALGINDNTHDLLIAQQKANLAVQFTVAIRNQVLDAYKEIMNLQF